MNSYLNILYGHVRQAVKEFLPKDVELIGHIAEMFLDFDKGVDVYVKPNPNSYDGETCIRKDDNICHKCGVVNCTNYQSLETSVITDE